MSRITGRRFRKTTGRTTSPKRTNTGAKMLKAWNTPQARRMPDNAAKLRAFQAGMKPIKQRQRKMGNPVSVTTSNHIIFSREQGVGVYGYIRP